MYKQELSIRSNVGFVATPTGEGVTYSPSFPSIQQQCRQKVQSTLFSQIFHDIDIGYRSIVQPL